MHLESHTLSWADAHWTNLQNPHEIVDDVACLDFYEDDIPVSMKIDATACASSSSELIWMTTYDSHGCGNDVDQVFNFTDGQCRKQETDLWSCFFIQNNDLHFGRCWNIFSVRLSCWDGSVAPVTGAITFSGLSLADAQANEAVLVDTIATSAGVDKSRVSISIATAARRRLADGVIVTYSIATDTTADADALVSTLSALTTEECSTALTTAAATHNVASIFESVTVTQISTPVAAAATAAPTAAPVAAAGPAAAAAESEDAELESNAAAPRRFVAASAPAALLAAVLA